MIGLGSTFKFTMRALQAQTGPFNENSTSHRNYTDSASPSNDQIAINDDTIAAAETEPVTRVQNQQFVSF